MITRPLLLILGAGASAPYGFPLGSRLVDLICDEPLEENAITGSKPDITPHFDLKQYAAFVGELRKSKLKSVDAFLENREEFRKIGKRAIAYQLLQYESIPIAVDANSKDDDWYNIVLYRLIDGAKTLNDVAKNHIAFVTFNYDRSLAAR